MAKHWLRYLAVWVICLIFYFAYREWMAWLLLMSVSFLPLLSLAVSLPAMLLSTFTLSLPDQVEMGTDAALDIHLKCPLPPPLWKLQIRCRHTLLGESWLLKPGMDCPTEHCGALYLHFSRARVYDYLGLFFLPKKAPTDHRLMIRPTAVEPKDLPDPEKTIITYWKPKPGGGFSENHELRLYRPGDSLRQIHWKLSGKTGKLIYREPMVRANNYLLLRLVHSGSAQELDQKLGKLLWLGTYLLRKRLAFDVAAETAEGQKIWHVDSKQAFFGVVDALLCCPSMEHGQLPPNTGAWQYDIGGDDHEA